MEITKPWKRWLKNAKEEDTVSDWDFNKFKIECSCGSKNVEIFGKGEIEFGYYDSADYVGKMLVKCHNCGKAMIINLESYWDLKTKNGGKPLSEID
jgi:hypothetical protein